MQQLKFLGIRVIYIPKQTDIGERRTGEETKKSCQKSFVEDDRNTDMTAKGGPCR
jgi:hypothetical protein